MNDYFINEREHGFKGEFQYYIECFKTNYSAETAKFFYFILKLKEPIRTNTCFCGSGKNIVNAIETFIENLQC